MENCIRCGNVASQEAQFKTVSLTDREHGIEEGDIFNQTKKFMVCDNCSKILLSIVMAKAGLDE